MPLFNEANTVEAYFRSLLCSKTAKNSPQNSDIKKLTPEPRNDESRNHLSTIGHFSPSTR